MKKSYQQDRVNAWDGNTKGVWHLGSNANNATSTGTSNATRKVEDVMDYYPYGSVRLDEKAGSFDEKRKYAGHEYDSETGLSYMVARYYDGGIGRFYGEDPVFWGAQALIDPQSMNSYSYARNNPMKYIDPTGMYNVKTGEIEEGDTEESITKAVNEAYKQYNLKATWDDIARVSFFEEKYQTTDPTKLVGKSTHVGTDEVTDITEELNAEISGMESKYADFEGSSKLNKFRWVFRPWGYYDLKNLHGNDERSRIFGSRVEGAGNGRYRLVRYNMAFIYNGKLMRYDQPGNYLAGYGAAFFGVTSTDVLTDAKIWSWVTNFQHEDPLDTKYLMWGYCRYLVSEFGTPCK